MVKASKWWRTRNVKMKFTAKDSTPKKEFISPGRILHNIRILLNCCVYMCFQPIAVLDSSSLSACILRDRKGLELLSVYHHR